jgi:cellulose synthase/poly-beta-1,6-N-acetylglucosamine synthase-like glycosyltransferase
MMFGFTALCFVLLFSASIQLFLVAGFIRRLRKPAPHPIHDSEALDALVVLCMRGGDPFLTRCIEGLLTQDYPCFHVSFVVDSLDDPANQILKKSLASHANKNYEILILDQALASCSLKCSSLVQALKSRMDSQGFVAFLDADTIPHKTWLRELAMGLQPPNVGAATGNRWYMPDHVSPGAMVRHVWNGAAVVQMFWYGIAWGGTLAVKWDTIRRAKLLDKWSLALCEDTMLCKQLRAISQKVAFVPSLMMINREDCSISSFYDWVKRQLLTAKLYHPMWIAVVGHGLSSAALIAWGWLACATYLLLGYSWLASCYAMAMISFQFFLTLMVPWIGSAVALNLRQRGEQDTWNARVGWLRYGWYVGLTQGVYTTTLIDCLRTKEVNWRGIQYRIDSPFCIRMLGYKPFIESQEVTKPTQSI